MIKHTPTPWRLQWSGALGMIVQDTQGYPFNEYADEAIAQMYCFGASRPKTWEANAEFIVRAVNSHYALVEACKAAQRELAHGGDHEAIEKLEAALKLAEAE